MRSNYLLTFVTLITTGSFSKALDINRVVSIDRSLIDSVLSMV